MAQLIRSNGAIENLIPKNKTKFTLEELQEAVNGYIEPIRLPQDKCCALVNEEGLLYHLPFNETASRLLGMKLVGNVLILKDEEWK